MKKVISRKHTTLADGSHREVTTGVSKGGRNVTRVETSKKLNKSGDFETTVKTTYRSKKAKSKSAAKPKAKKVAAKNRTVKRKTNSKSKNSKKR